MWIDSCNGTVERDLQLEIKTYKKKCHCHGQIRYKRWGLAKKKKKDIRGGFFYFKVL